MHPHKNISHCQRAYTVRTNATGNLGENDDVSRLERKTVSKETLQINCYSIAKFVYFASIFFFLLLRTTKNGIYNGERKPEEVSHEKSTCCV